MVQIDAEETRKRKGGMAR